MGNSIKRLYAVIALLVCVAVGLLIKSSFSQDSAVQSSGVGRYQMVIGSGGRPIVIDTRSGRCWSQNGVFVKGKAQWDEISPDWANSN